MVKKLLKLSALALCLMFGSKSFAQSGAALNFDGANDYVTAPGYDVGTSDFSIEAWIRPTANAQSGILTQGGYSCVQGFLFDFNAVGTGSLRLETSTGSCQGAVQANGVLALNTWQHVVVSVTRGSSGNLTKLYVNGNVVASGNIPAGNLSNTALNIGRITNTGHHFPGSIDEVRIWSRALSQAEIQGNMNVELGPGQNGLQAYYQFNHGVASGNNAGITTLNDASGNNRNGTLFNFALSGSTSNWIAPGGVASASGPTTQAASIAFGSTTATGSTINWTNGNGSSRAVFVKSGTASFQQPGDNTTYIGNTAFQSGTQIGSTGWYCVYNGTGTSVAITGLTQNSTYSVQVVDYNGTAAGTELYSTATGTSNPGTFTTLYAKPTAQASQSAPTNITTTSAKINWFTGNGTNRVVFVIAASSGSPAPADLTTYNPSTNFGSGTQIGSTGWYCVYNGSSNTVTINNLTLGTNFRTMVVEYNGTPGKEQYLTSPGSNNPGNFPTLANPATQASNVNYASTTSIGTTVSWTNGSGSRRVVFMATGSGNSSPSVSDGSAFSANAVFGNGSSRGNWYCIYDGTGSSVTVTNLQSHTTYETIVFEYNVFSSTTQYKTSTATNNPRAVTTTTPVLNSAGTLSALSTVAGTASSSTSFSVSGTDMAAGIHIIAPAGFEVSTDNTNFAGDITVGSAGIIPSTTIYVRLAAANAVGTYSGDINLASNGAASINVPTVSSNVVAPPSITSFSPLSGAVGTVVTITGTNFNTTNTNNIVFFGATRASVSVATSTNLTVTVPAGASYAQITILNTATGLGASSPLFFTPSFPGKGSISASDIETKVDFTTGVAPFSVAIGDIDGDGKPDLVATNENNWTVSVLRSTGTPGNMAFATKVDFPTGMNPFYVAIGDIDGDGKLDLVVANSSSNTVSVLRNTSSSGSISFAASVNISTGTGGVPWAVAIGDINGDGKSDIAITNFNFNSVSILANTGSPGSISFAPKRDFGTSINPVSVAIGDIDTDGKPDLAVANFGSSQVSILRNTSSSSNITFASKLDFTSGTNVSSVVMGDMDGDGKLDLTIANYSSSDVSILRNTSSTGNINFVTQSPFYTGSNVSVAIGDIDGDGKPDVATANKSNNTVSILHNTSISGSISFNSKVDKPTGLAPQFIAVGDLDGDGKPDLTTVNRNDNTISVLRNNPQLTATLTTTTPTSISSSTAVLGGNVTSDGGNAVTENGVVYSVSLNPTTSDTKVQIGSGSGIFSQSVTGLSSDTAYHVRAYAINSMGTSYGNDVLFNTLPSTNAGLASLTLSSGTLSPAFSSGTGSYTASVSDATSSITITPTVAEPNATIKVNGVTVTSDNPSNSIPLTVGSNNVITLVVTAQDGTTTQTYTVTVTRAVPPLPYSETFRYSTAANMVYGGTPLAAMLTAVSTDAEGSGYLRLTNAGANQLGFTRNTTAFPSANGLSVSFDYYTYGGSGGDGLSFFLYDAAASPFQFGSAGGSLGYAQTTNSGGLPGVSKGYLGIGLDEFGNFSNPTAGRQGGPGAKASAIAIRGDGDGSAAIASNYEFLTGVQTTNAAAMTAAGAGSTFAIAGMVNGRSGISIARPQGGLTATDNGYRRVKVELVPNGSGTGYILNVWITEGTAGGGVQHHVVTDYNYIGSTMPSALSYGFAASTGGYNNSHEIRNLEIMVPQGGSLQAPTVTDITKAGTENTVVPFTKLNFTSKYSSPIGIPLNKIKVLSLPDNGTLKLSGTPVTLNQEIVVANLSNITFVPDYGFSGNTIFEWNGSDGVLYSDSYARVTMSLAPAGTAAFPYSESFKNNTAAGMAYGGTAGLTSGTTDATGTGYLRLTTNAANQSGFARNNTAFPAADGFSISFEYYTYGGSGADGISFFLYDATANSAFTIGAPGGSLGYAQTTAIPGVSKGFIGFGFDEFGNFSTASAGRQGGPGALISSLTMRGDGNGPGAGSPAGSNYEFLKNIQTNNSTAMTAAGGGTTFNIGGSLNGRTGGAAGLTPANTGYRKTRIEMLPNGQDNGYIINVWITEGNTSGPVEHHVVTNYSYIPTTGIPNTLSYGFAGSTGGFNNYHEVRNLEITVPGAVAIPFVVPVNNIAQNDLLNVFGSTGNTSTKTAQDGTARPEPSNILTPNGDGKNDTWVIRNISSFLANTVTIIDRSGKMVYKAQNYQNDWDGTSNGIPFNAGTYYYILETGNNNTPIKGYISIVR